MATTANGLIDLRPARNLVIDVTDYTKLIVMNTETGIKEIYPVTDPNYSLILIEAHYLQIQMTKEGL